MAEEILNEEVVLVVTLEILVKEAILVVSEKILVAEAGLVAEGRLWSWIKWRTK